MRRQHPAFFYGGTKVLDVGSRNINGSVREFFLGCEVLGIDCHHGKGVDIVILAHRFVPGHEDYFDVVCSTNALEHDPFARATLRAMYRLCRHGGLLFFSAAGPGTPEHGTVKAPREHGPYGPLPDHYMNLDEIYFREECGGVFVLDGDQPEFSEWSLATVSCHSKAGSDLLFSGIVSKEGR